MRWMIASLAGAGLALALAPVAEAQTARAKEWAAIGRQPESTPEVAKGLGQRITKLPVPQKFKVQARAVLKQALKLEAGPRDRNDAVLEEGGLDRGWISFSGQKGGKQVQKYVSVNRSTGGGSHSVGLDIQTRVVDGEGRGVEVWRGIKPVLGGIAVEDMHVSRFLRQGGGDRYPAGTGSFHYFMVGRDGKRLAEITQDQALAMQGDIKGRRVMLASQTQSYFWDLGYRVQPLTPDGAARLRQTGTKVLVTPQPSYYLVSDAGAFLAPITPAQMATLAAAGMKVYQPKK